MAKRDPLPDTPNTWGGTVAFHPLDDRLRAAGFVVVRRPRRGPDLWRHEADKERRLYTVREACALVGIRFDDEE